MACGRPSAPVPGGTMPMLCPSSTGNATAPKSRMRWWTSELVPDLVTRMLPVTLAMAGEARLNRLTRGLEADSGARTRPPAPLCASAMRAAASSSSASTASPSPEAAGSAGLGGSSCQESWSSRLNGAATWNQLSMAPVGHGATQSMQKLQVPTSTT